MKRAIVLAAAGLCVAAAAHAQGSASKKYDWNDANKQSCMEPYAPAVPKAEETSLQELLDEVKPEIHAFIEESNKYLECIGVQIQKAREEEDEVKLKKLVKAHNDNVEYQKSVAGEFNAALLTLKEKAGLAVSNSEKTDGKDADNPGESKSPDAAGATDGSEGTKTSEPATTENKKDPSEG